MAHLHFTLNQEEIQELLLENRSEAFKKLLESALNSVLQAESEEQLSAGRYQRSDERTDYRNGSRDRELNTRIGRITLHVPRHRNVPFRTLVFENYSRSEAALIAGMAEMVVNGVSTRKVSKVMETLCGTSFSKSAVSDVCKDLSKEVSEFQRRPIEGDYPFVTVDATYFKVREDHRVTSKALMIALGTNCNGHGEVLGFGIYPSESAETWTDFLLSLKKRGLSGALMITSDAHDGILKAIDKVYPTTPWQRCQFHFSKNIADKAPKKYQTGLRTELHEMFGNKTIEAARKIRDRIIDDYRDVAESAVACLDEGFESAMTVMTLPEHLRRFYRTSNNIERINKELKRRSKVIGVFPNAESLLRLMGSVLIELHGSMASGKAVFSKETLATIMTSDIPENLISIAKEQHQLRAA